MSKPQKRQPPKTALPPVDPFMDNPEAEPARKIHVSARNMRRLLVTGVVALTVTTCAVGLKLATGDQQQEVPEVLSTDVNDSAGKSMATKTLLDWLDTEPVPGATMAGWDGVSITPSPSEGLELNDQQQSRVPNYETEVHHFTVIDANGVLYSASVTVETHERNGVRTAGTPSLERRAPDAPTGDGWGFKTTWWGWTSTTSPAPVNDAVQTWAEALTGGDPNRLRMTVGDPDSSHSYMPLGTALPGSTTAKVTDAGFVTVEDGNTPDMSTLLVRVEVETDLSGEVDEAGQSTRQSLPLFSYDVLVVDADTASPKVVSWGAVGSGPTLELYSVAIDGREVEVPTTEPTVAPTPSGEPETETIPPSDPNA